VKKGYKPHDFYQANEELRAVVDWIGSNFFTPDEPGALRMLYENLIQAIRSVPGDYQSYVDCHQKADAAFKGPPALGEDGHPQYCAAMGKFSSDRTIAQYASGDLEVGSGERVESEVAVQFLN